MPAAVRNRSGIPIRGLKKTQAIAIVRQERVKPTRMANMNAANDATDPKSEPTRGIHVNIAIIGENKR